MDGNLSEREMEEIDFIGAVLEAFGPCAPASDEGKRDDQGRDREREDEKGIKTVVCKPYGAYNHYDERGSRQPFLIAFDFVEIDEQGDPTVEISQLASELSLHYPEYFAACGKIKFSASIFVKDRKDKDSEEDFPECDPATPGPDYYGDYQKI